MKKILSDEKQRRKDNLKLLKSSFADEMKKKKIEKPIKSELILEILTYFFEKN